MRTIRERRKIAGRSPKVMPLHEANADEIRYLFEYKRGIQPIRNRIKPIRSEINYKVVEKSREEIVDFEVGYVFGSPITLVHKNKQNGDEVVDDGNIALLNEMLHEEGRSGRTDGWVNALRHVA